MEKIAVFGLGYAGLPLSLTYTLHEAQVYGVDINKEYVELLKKGKTHVYEEYNGKTIEEILKGSLNNNLFIPTTSYEEVLRKVSNIILTIGIPIKQELIKLDVELLGSLMKEKSIIFDPKGLLDRKEIEKLGFVYISI